MSRRAPAPPIRVGSKAVTYTPPRPWPGDDRYKALVFHCELVSLTIDGAPIEEMDAERNWYGHAVFGDLRGPDGTDYPRVPYKSCTEDEGATGSWCWPWLSSVALRYGS